MTDIYFQALLDALAKQRDAALNALARSEAEIAELKAQLAEKEKADGDAA